ncbi:MAG TPA: hypothetical protein VHV81_01610 [Steroidobacteraceae bacterium]|jgi:hypothetical protein|nr:hypothetical protein [Steroidobacteraceae bacterium]
MQRDCLSNPLSAQREATARAIDDFIEGFLAYERRAEGIVAAADADPGSCLANVYAGFLWMLLESPRGVGFARRHAEAARRAARGSSRREQLNLQVLEAWVDDDLGTALRVCDAATDQFPRDLALIKLQQYFEFNRGNSPAMLRAALKAQQACAEVAYVHGMAAFGYEQCHRLDEAEAAARRALDMRHREPWAQHALAHVYLTRGRIDEGCAFLETAAGTWTGLNSFMLTHLWWHLALFYVSQGREREALVLYDRHCWGVAKDCSQDQVGAVSLLARLELAGIEVGSRWRELADHLAARTSDTVQPFLTLQYLYGLARAARVEAETLLESVRCHAAHAPEFTREVWRAVALPACEGLAAHARGDYATAWRHLSASVPRIAEVGGSHAQRDLFEQILLDACLKTGRLSAAQQTLELRRMADPDGVPVNEALAQLYARLGLPQLAAGAAEQARRRRTRLGGEPGMAGTGARTNSPVST